MIKLFFYCHYRFLPTKNKYRKNQKNFFVGRVERDVILLVPSSEELYDVVLWFESIVFGFQSKKEKAFWFWCDPQQG